MTSPSHCFVLCYPLINQILLLPSCTSRPDKQSTVTLLQFLQSRTLPPHHPTELPIITHPNNQLLQSYLLTNSIETLHRPQYKLHIGVAGLLKPEGGKEERGSYRQ